MLADYLELKSSLWQATWRNTARHCASGRGLFASKVAAVRQPYYGSWQGEPLHGRHVWFDAKHRTEHRSYVSKRVSQSTARQAVFLPSGCNTFPRSACLHSSSSVSSSSLSSAGAGAGAGSGVFCFCSFLRLKGSSRLGGGSCGSSTSMAPGPFPASCDLPVLF